MKSILIITLTLCLFALNACDNYENNISSNEHPMLENNTQWPIEIVGTIDFIEVNGWEGGYPTWGVGSINTDDSEDEIMVEFNNNIMVDSKYDTDSLDKVRVWLNPAKNEHYQITKLEKI